MRLKKVVEPADAVAVIHAGDTVASAGYAGSGTPDQLFVSLEQRFLETGSPRGEDRLTSDPEANIVYMNFSGLRVRDQADLRTSATRPTGCSPRWESGCTPSSTTSASPATRTCSTNTSSS